MHVFFILYKGDIACFSVTQFDLVYIIINLYIKKCINLKIYKKIPAQFIYNLYNTL